MSPPSSPLAITIEATREPPPPPTGLALAPDSDTGQLGDNVTSDATPAITGTGSSGNTVTLFVDGTAVGTGTVQSNGTWRVELSQLTVAQHNITATQSDPAGLVSPPSSPLAITIEATREPPPPPTGLALAPDSDTGQLGDNVTSDATPAITGTGISGNTVTLFVDGTAVGTGTVQSNGTWRVELSQLTVAQHNITATQSDPAGLVSPPSSPLAITIEATREPPPPPTGLALAPDSDTGQLGDNVTSDATPAITGTGISGDTVTLFVDGTAVGTGTVQSDGSWRVELSQLTVAQHNITATQSDSAGLVSPPSSPFPLTIEAAPPIGGRWIFSSDMASSLSGIILAINNGIAPVFPRPQVGKLNIEVFTNPTLDAIPEPEPGFQAAMIVPSGTLDDGFLTGTNLRLGSGDFLAVNSITGASAQIPSKITLGSGNQTIVGARFDTLIGGSGSQVLSALVGNETVVGGTGSEVSLGRSPRFDPRGQWFG